MIAALSPVESVGANGWVEGHSVRTASQPPTVRGQTMGNRIVVHPGERFGRLTVVREVAGTAYGTKIHRRMECRCDCGSLTATKLAALRSGATKSCGCLKAEVATLQVRHLAKTHGLSGHPAFPVWANMRGRCKPSFVGREHYYDKGVRICPEWRDTPVAFLRWAEASGFAEGMELDRIDNDLVGDRAYSPENCRWVTRTENARNKSTAYIWYASGARYETAQEAARVVGISTDGLAYRCDSPNFPAFYREKRYP